MLVHSYCGCSKTSSSDEYGAGGGASVATEEEELGKRGEQ
jgi:hypothetical protein